MFLVHTDGLETGQEILEALHVALDRVAQVVGWMRDVSGLALESGWLTSGEFKLKRAQVLSQGPEVASCEYKTKLATSAGARRFIQLAAGGQNVI